MNTLQYSTASSRSGVRAAASSSGAGDKGCGCGAPLQPSLRAHPAKNVRHRAAGFPGAAGPGTGARHLPKEFEEQSNVVPFERSAEHFEMKATRELYEQFPVMVRASTPLYIRHVTEPQEPAGVAVQKLPDAGPITGRRRFPEPIDWQQHTQPRPGHSQRQEDLVKEVQSRRGC